MFVSRLDTFALPNRRVPYGDRHQITDRRPQLPMAGSEATAWPERRLSPGMLSCTIVRRRTEYGSWRVGLMCSSVRAKIGQRARNAILCTIIRQRCSSCQGSLNDSYLHISHIHLPFCQPRQCTSKVHHFSSSCKIQVSVRWLPVTRNQVFSDMQAN